MEAKLDIVLANQLATDVNTPGWQGGASPAAGSAWTLAEVPASPPGLQPRGERLAIDDSTGAPGDEPHDLFYQKPPVMMRLFNGGYHECLTSIEWHMVLCFSKHGSRCNVFRNSFL